MNQTPPATGWKKQITLFLISQNISLFGSSVVGFAIIWHITLSTSSGTWVMLSTICSTLPQVFVALLGGVFADRHNRKYLIMLSDGFIALATFILAISFVLGFERLDLLLIASVIRSIGAGIQTPAVSAIYPQLVPQESLTKVQGINQTLSSVLMLLAPAVGGIILGWVGIVAAFFVDVITAVIAIFVMSRIQVESVNRTNTDESIWADLKSGLKYTFGNIHLRRVLICFLFSFFLITPAAVLSPLLVERSFGNEVWRLTANEIVWTIGSLVGGIFVSLKGQFKNKIQTVAISLAAFGILFALLGVAWNFIVFLVFMGIAGFFLPAMNTAMTVHIQEITPPETLGRVFSIVQIIAGGAMPVAILLFGPLADKISVNLILLISGVLLALVGVLYGYGYRNDKPAVSE